jgi:hypothetical protein
VLDFGVTAMPINMNPADVAKMADGVKVVLEIAMRQGKTRAFVKTRDFFELMKFSNLRLVKFSEELADYMTTTEAHKRFGEWIFTEFGDGYSVFVEMAKKGEPSGLDAHAQRDDAYFLPSTGRGMTHFNSLQHLIDANAEDKAAERKRNFGNVADMHDEDIRRAAENNSKA